MAAHIQEQEELENFKYFWKSWGRWLFAALVLAALVYLGYILYQNHVLKKDQEAAAVLVQMVEKAQSKADAKAINADLQNLQQNYSSSIAASQATMMVAATEFDKGKYDIAAGHLNWVLKNQKNPLVQTLASKRLAVVYLQQKKYDEALAVLDRKVEASFEPLLQEARGDVYLAQGKNKEALQAYEQALSKVPKDAVDQELLLLKAEELK